MSPGPATLDLVVLGVLLLFAVAGAFTGALRQVVRLAAVVAGWLAARHLAPILAGPLLGARPPSWERGALAAGCFLAAVVVVSLAGGALARSVEGPGGAPGPTDRALGALLGAAKAALACWVLLSALALARGPIGLPGGDLDVRASRTGAWVAGHNLLEAAAPRQAALLGRIFEALRDPGVRERLRRGDADLKRALDDPRVKALLERGASGGKADAGDLSEEELEALLERLQPGAAPHRSPP